MLEFHRLGWDLGFLVVGLETLREFHRWFHLVFHPEFHPGFLLEFPLEFHLELPQEFHQGFPEFLEFHQAELQVQLVSETLDKDSGKDIHRSQSLPWIQDQVKGNPQAKGLGSLEME